MKEIEELLKDWNLIQPERCNYHDSADTWEVYHLQSWRAVTKISRIDSNTILGAVIEAIEAEGWGWHLNKEFSGGYDGLVMTENAIIALNRIIRDQLEKEWVFKERHSYYVCALLSAFLTALKYESERSQTGNSELDQ